MIRRLEHLQELESESIYTIREVLSQFANPCLLFSGGKDSIVLTHLLKKAVWPETFPIPLVHVDTGHNFDEVIEFRDQLVATNNARLVVASVEKAIAEGRVLEEQGKDANRNALQTESLLTCIREHKFDACIAGARRDEEKSRAKERFFSHRNAEGQWEPNRQQPELWTLFNGHKKGNEHFRVFPLSNWTEIDIWEYILEEKIQVPSLYFSHNRTCFRRNNTIISANRYQSIRDDEALEDLTVRFRTMGDITITGATESKASTVPEIIDEILTSDYTERGQRADDQRSDSAMEDRKKQGYF